jgi:hypothetical protein
MEETFWEEIVYATSVAVGVYYSIQSIRKHGAYVAKLYQMDTSKFLNINQNRFEYYTRQCRKPKSFDERQ